MIASFISLRFWETLFILNDKLYAFNNIMENIAILALDNHILKFWMENSFLKLLNVYL